MMSYRHYICSHQCMRRLPALSSRSVCLLESLCTFVSLEHHYLKVCTSSVRLVHKSQDQDPRAGTTRTPHRGPGIRSRCQHARVSKEVVPWSGLTTACIIHGSTHVRAHSGDTILTLTSTYPPAQVPWYLRDHFTPGTRPCALTLGFDPATVRVHSLLPHVVLHVSQVKVSMRRLQERNSLRGTIFPCKPPAGSGSQACFGNIL